MEKHYIATAGMRGCLPNNCGVYESLDDAADYLARLHDKDEDWAAHLKVNGFLALDLQEDGNEYCEIVQCFCETPADHLYGPFTFRNETR